jgi:hypothetical protein
MTEKTVHAAVAGHNRRTWPLLFLLVLAAVSLLLHIEKARRQKEVGAAKRQYSLMVRSKPIEKFKDQRGRFYKIQYYLGYPSATSHALADFVRRLGASIHPGQLLDCQLDPQLQNFSFRSIVAIAASGPQTARLAFAACFEKLRSNPDITRIAFEEHGAAKAAGNGTRVYVFSITGQAELL